MNNGSSTYCIFKPSAHTQPTKPHQAPQQSPSSKITQIQKAT